MEQLPDTLSPAARQVVKLDFADAYTRLVLGTIDAPGNEQARPLLDAIRPEDLLVPGSGKSDDDRKSALAALYLWHDWLTPAHELCQDVDTPTGSYLHAIVHRREGDFGNAKYWYARAAGHTVLSALGTNVGVYFHALPADKASLRIIAAGFNPAAFVDFVQQVNDAPPDDPRRRAAVGVQQMEWRLLFDGCTRR